MTTAMAASNQHRALLHAARQLSIGAGPCGLLFICPLRSWKLARAAYYLTGLAGVQLAGLVIASLALVEPACRSLGLTTALSTTACGLLICTARVRRRSASPWPRQPLHVEQREALSWDRVAISSSPVKRVNCGSIFTSAAEPTSARRTSRAVKLVRHLLVAEL